MIILFEPLVTCTMTSLMLKVHTQADALPCSNEACTVFISVFK